MMKKLLINVPGNYLFTFLVIMLLLSFAAPMFSQAHDNFTVPIFRLKKAGMFSGDVNYYTAVEENGAEFLRAHYKYPMKTVTLGYEVPASMTGFSKLSWKWRVHKHPEKADERMDGKRDSAGAVYCIFEKGIYTYTIKYVFSSIAPVGTVIKDDPGLFKKMFVVVRNTQKLDNKGRWVKAYVNFNRDFKRLYKMKKTPPLRGIGIMTDGDGSKSEVITDYTDFILAP